MRKLLASVTVGLVLGAGIASIATVSAATGRPAANSAASTTTTTTPVTAPPVQTRHNLSIVMYVDTVQGQGGNPAPAVGCSMTNLFLQGQVVVFRMWGNDVASGGAPLTDKNVRTAYVQIPGAGIIPLVYGAHGKVAYWTAAWKTAGYPYGVVNFRVTAVTLAAKATKTHPAIPAQVGFFTQAGLPSVSQLTIT